jgi:hypothetical protein
MFAGLAPAFVMAALWHTAEVAPCIFIFTFAIAFGHAVLLGLPLFLVFRSTSWINVTACVVLGLAVGAAPVSVLTWPQHSEAIRAIGWTGYIKPLIDFGSLRALGGSGPL